MKQFFRVVSVVAVLTLGAGFSAFAAEEKRGAVASKEGAQKEAVQAPKGKTIYDYKSELNLTDDQIAKIKELISNLEKDVKVLQARITIVNADLEPLIKKDDLADMPQIKAKLKERYDLLSQIDIANIETRKKINTTLSPAQLKKWREIQAAARK
ncbi:MAG: hypothetical protein Q8K68_03830 [Nitrospirota bacterium]|nr:hypothetical protein [Nitrospirota bacterium]